MKNLKKLLVASAIATSAIGGGLSALGKDTISPGGYEFNQSLLPYFAWLDVGRQSVTVNNLIDPESKMVSYWHAWFWGNDQTNRSETTYIKNSDKVRYAAYGNTGYVAVVEIQTTNYFYFIEFSSLNYAVSLTYNTTGDYPLFLDSHWTLSHSIDTNSSVFNKHDELNISKNAESTELHLNWDAGDSENTSIGWTLPY